MADSTTLPDALLKNIHALLNEQREALANDRIPNLTELESIVKQLCEAIIQLPQEQGLFYEPQLKEIMGFLDIWSKELINHRDQLKNKIQGLGEHQHAQKAYITINSYPRNSSDESSS